MSRAIRLITGWLGGCGILLVIWFIERSLTKEESMDREAKQYFKFWAIIALIIMVANMVGCAKTVYVDRPIERPAPYVLLPDVLFTRCDGVHLCTLAQVECSVDNRPVILVRKSLTNDSLFAFTKAHEDRHLKQMSGDCRRSQKAYMDSLHVRIRMEAEAYCSEAQARLKVYKDVQVVGSWFASMMAQLFEVENIVCTIRPP